VVLGTSLATLATPLKSLNISFVPNRQPPHRVSRRTCCEPGRDRLRWLVPQRVFLHVIDYNAIQRALAGLKLKSQLLLHGRK
jgi:hypothetical protein